MMRPFLSALLLTGCLGLMACGQPKPVQIGFIGGLTGANSDNGQSGLNGVTLAVEQFNRDGGVDGRMVEVLVRDDAQSVEVATRSAGDLVAAKVETVIGPFTSAMAQASVPVTGKAGIVQVSPTITSMDFYGKDDNLFRINRTTRDNARDYAAVMTGLGQRRIAVAYDLRNRSFTESWLGEFRQAIAARDAQIAKAVPYESTPSTDFAQVVRSMLEGKPDSLFFISGALDVARLAQEARRQAPTLPIGASEWAATEQLIDLGGSVVEGLLIAQNYDRTDTSDDFRAFNDAYVRRFQRQPGYSSVSAYDAATVVLAALKNRRKDQSMKAAMLTSGPYKGLQQTIVFDANGDTQRKVYFTRITDGRFVKIHQ